MGKIGQYNIFGKIDRLVFSGPNGEFRGTCQESNYLAYLTLLLLLKQVVYNLFYHYHLIRRFRSLYGFTETLFDNTSISTRCLNFELVCHGHHDF